MNYSKPFKTSLNDNKIISSTSMNTNLIDINSVTPVPAPPVFKPKPPMGLPPKNVNIYDPNKYSKIFNGNRKNSNKNRMEFKDIEYVQEPPMKKRKLYQERYKLEYLGLTPMQAKVMIELIDNKPKLRYGDELRRDITNTMNMVSDNMAKKLSRNNITVQDIFPTSNGIDKQHIKTELGCNPINQNSSQKFRASLLSQTINSMIYLNEKDKIDSKLNRINNHNNRNNDKSLQKAKNESIEIARKLGFLPKDHKHKLFPNIKDSDIITEPEPIKQISNVNRDGHNSPNEISLYSLTRNSNGVTLAPTPNEFIFMKNRETQIKKKMSTLTGFVSNTVLKPDGYEYELNGKLKHKNERTKYDTNFRPMYPITNDDYQFKIVSQFGYKILKKYGFKYGDGLGKDNQGIKTYPRLDGQTSFKGIKYNHRKYVAGFIHCVCCDKAFASTNSVKQHLISKNHIKKVSVRPNNLVLLCVYCQIQFESLHKIKEHFLLIKHDENKIPGLKPFMKSLKLEFQQKQTNQTSNNHGNIIQEMNITQNICFNIQAKLKELNVLTPIIKPNVPWIYCISCQLFFKTFKEYNIHYGTNIHINSFMNLTQNDKIKFNEFQKYLNAVQDSILIQNHHKNS